MTDSKIPTDIQLHTRSRELELSYASGENYRLNCEFLRVYSPSAEVIGHGTGQEVLQAGKIDVGITEIKPVGNYALQLVFDDGHATGLYSWNYLYKLCIEHGQLWQNYLDRLNAAGESRDPQVQVLKLGD